MNKADKGQTLVIDYDKDGMTGKFSDITFEAAGDYEFSVHEKDVTANSTRKDSTVYTWLVTVGDDKDTGVLKVTGSRYYVGDNYKTTTVFDANDPADYFEFTNIYDLKTVEAYVEVTKKFSGRDWKDSDKFTFEALYKSGDETGYTLEKSILTLDGKSDVDGEEKGEFKFTFSKAGTYVFDIAEQHPDETSDTYNGITYDSSVYTVTFEVTDIGGALSVDKTVKVTVNGETDETVNVVFTNEYKVGVVTWTPEVVKTIVNRNRLDSDDNFTFNVELDKGDSESVNPDNTKINVSSGSAAVPGYSNSFRATAATPIEFTKAGTYTFKVSEEKGLIPEGAEYEYEYDSTVYTVEVTVTDNGEGVLSLTSSITEKNGVEISEELKDMTFINTYIPSPVELELPFDIVKQIDAREWNDKTPETQDESFTFKIKLDKIQGLDGVKDDDIATVINKINENLKNSGKDTVVISDESSTVISVEADEKASDAFRRVGHTKLSLDDLKFADSSESAATLHTGDYYFTIQEEKPTPAPEYMTYDETVYNVVISVKSDGSTTTTTTTLINGEGLEIKDGTSIHNAILITNKYTADPVKWQPAAEKKISGRDWTESDEFGVQLILTGADPDDGVNYKVDSQNTVVITNASESHIGNFNEITFTKAGTYTFEMKEVPGFINDLAYDSKSYTITVEVTDNKEGSLVTKVTYKTSDDSTENVSTDNKFTFENIQTAYWTPKVMKTIDGQDWIENRSTSFEFQITASAADDNYSNIVFPASAVTDTDGTTVTTTVRPGTTDQTAGFGVFKFKAEGDYHFTVSETVPAEKHGYEYSDKTYNVTVNVGKDSAGGLVVEDVTDTDTHDSIKDKAFEFVNTYSPAPLELELNFTKEFEGWKGKFENEVFNFEIKQNRDRGHTEAEIVSSPVSLDNTSDGKGKVTIKFNTPDSYEFTVREVHGSNENIIYDANVYTINLTVDDENGILTIRGNKVQIVNTSGTASGSVDVNISETVGSDSDTTTTKCSISGDQIKFINTVKSEVGWTPKIAKILNGRAMTENDKFTFRIEYSDPEHHITYSEKEPAAANVPMMIANSAGNFAEIDITGPADADTEVIGEFGTFTFDADGDYTFTIRETAEINDIIKGITYSKAVYTVTVHVNKRADGILEVDRVDVDTSLDNTTDEKYNENTNTFTFVNEFKPAKWTPEVTKIINGDVPEDWEEHSFEFILTPADDYTGKAYIIDAYGNKAELSKQMSASVVVDNSTKTNTAAFDTIYFNKEGTYNFTLTEKNDTEEKGIKYDTTVYEITLKVTPGDSGLEAAASVTAGGNPYYNPKFEFKNVILKPTEWTPSITKKVTGDPLPDTWNGSFTFELVETDKDGNDIENGVSRTVTVGKDALDSETAFDSMEYNSEGTHYYRISETAGELPGFDYDKTKYFVTVVVTANGDKLEPAATAVTIVDGDENNYVDESYNFSNNYKVTPVEWTPGVSKKITASDGLTLPADWNGIFTFTLEQIPDPDDSASELTSDTVDIEMSASDVEEITEYFNTITFDRAGTYNFTLSENAGTISGIVYDRTIYEFTVTVKDIDAVLTVTSVTATETPDVSYAAEDPVFEFTNEYAPAKWAPVIEKKFENLPNNWKGGSYTFVLTPVPVDDGNELTEDKINLEGIIAKDSSGNEHSFVDETTGKIVPLEFTKTYPETGSPDENSIMGSLLFTEEGIYDFTITEKKAPADLTMTYDTKAYNIRVTVTRNDDETDDIPDGTIVAVPKDRTTDENAPMTYIFTNKYKPSESETQPSESETQPSETQPSVTQPGQTTENTPSVTPGKPHGPEAPKTDPIKLTKTYEGVSLGALSDNERYQLLSHTRFQISDPMGNQDYISLQYDDGKAYFSIDRIGGNSLSPNTTYNIIEAEAPEGYERAGRILVKIDENGKVTWSDDNGKTYRPGSIVVKNMKKPAETEPNVPSIPETPAETVIPGKTGVNTPTPTHSGTAAPPEEDFGAGAGIIENKEKTDKTVTGFITAAAFLVAMGAGSTALRSRKRRKK